MTLQEMLDRIKHHPEFDKAGMVLCHNGVVRATARDGRAVSGLEVAVDHAALEHLLTKQKQRPGIIEILVWINQDRPLHVGDDVMYLAVAGDIRENVITVLQDTLDTIKTTVTRKTEYFV